MTERLRYFGQQEQVAFITDDEQIHDAIIVSVHQGKHKGNFTIIDIDTGRIEKVQMKQLIDIGNDLRAIYDAIKDTSLNTEERRIRFDQFIDSELPHFTKVKGILARKYFRDLLDIEEEN